jgi:putative Holliday junction resolvase
MPNPEYLRKSCYDGAMRVLAIDYGTKRVGLALSDPSGKFARPYAVWPRSADLVERLATLCAQEAVGEIVLGESKNFAQAPNAIMKRIEKFKRELTARSGLPVVYEPEFLTSAQAARAGGPPEELDAQAAALILQSYLERQS